MGSTYLDLTNRVLRRLNEVELTESTFASARGVHATAKDAVLDAIRKINTQKFEWPFNSTDGTQVLEVGKEEYSFPADKKTVDWDSFYIPKDTTFNINTTKLKVAPLNEWRNYSRQIDFDSETTGRSLPYRVFATKNGGFGVSPSPDKAYTLNYKYFIINTDLDVYSDQTTIPTIFDYVIVDGALAYMYYFMDNSERGLSLTRDFEKGIDYMAKIYLPPDPYLWAGAVNHAR